MNVYAESSAILAWLLDEDAGSEVREVLTAAESVVASDLTIVECERVLLRAAKLGELTEAETADRRAHLAKASAQWHLLRISEEIVDRARQPFPSEAIRTLDALHLASAVIARSAIAGLELLSLDDRVRRAGEFLGMRALPERLLATDPPAANTPR